MGQNDGFLIEKKIKELINNKKFINIHPRIQKILKSWSKNINDNSIFNCEKKEGAGLGKKVDLYISVGGKIFCKFSIKSGGGNSVHQENIYSFVDFLKKIGASKNEIDALLFFHWGDTSYDGSAGEKNIELRMDSFKITKNYPGEVQTINQLFKKYSKLILERVFLGTDMPNILIYVKDSSLNEIISLPIIDIIDYEKKINNQPKNVKLGNLNLQNWNRCLSGQELTTGKHRNDIQFKYSNLYNNLTKINNEK